MKQTTLAISLTLLACGQVGTTDGTTRDLDQEDAGAGVEAAPSQPVDSPAPDERSADSGASVVLSVPVPRIDVEEHQEEHQEDAGKPVEVLDAGAELVEVLDVDAGDAGEPLDAGEPVEVLDVDAATGGDGPATGAALTPEQIAELCALPEPPPEAAPYCP
jgi:hypothetical protein